MDPVTTAKVAGTAKQALAALSGAKGEAVLSIGKLSCEFISKNKFNDFP